MAGQLAGPSALAGMMDDLGISRQDDLPMTDTHRGASGYRPGRRTGFASRAKPGQTAAGGWGVLAKDGIQDAESEGVRGLDDLGGGRIHAAGHAQVLTMFENVGARQHRARQEAARLATTRLGGLHRPDTPVRIFINSRRRNETASAPGAVSQAGTAVPRSSRHSQPTRTAGPLTNRGVQPTRSVRPPNDLPSIPASQPSVAERNEWEAVFAQTSVRNHTNPTPSATFDAGLPAASSPAEPSAEDDSSLKCGWVKPNGEESQDAKDPGPDGVYTTERQQPEHPPERAVETPAKSVSKTTQEHAVLVVSWPQLCCITIGTGDRVCRVPGSLIVKLFEQGINFKIGFIFRTGEGKPRVFSWEGLKAVDFNIRNEAGQPLPTCKMEFFVREPDGSKGQCTVTLNFASITLLDELKERVKTLRDIMSLNKEVEDVDGHVQDFLDQSTVRVQDGEEVDIALFIEDAVKHIATRNKIEPQAVTPRLATLFKIVFIRSLQERVRFQEDHGQGEETPINPKMDSSIETTQLPTTKKEEAGSIEEKDAEAGVKKTVLVPTAAAFHPSIDLSPTPKVKLESLSRSPKVAIATVEGTAVDVASAQNQQLMSEIGHENISTDHTSTDPKTERSEVEDLIDVETNVALKPAQLSEPKDGSDICTEVSTTTSSQKNQVVITTTEVRRTGKLLRKTVTVEEYAYDDSAEN